MFIRYKFEDTLKAIKDNEEKYANLLKEGSKDFEDLQKFIYFSGLHNGFNLAWKGFDGASEAEFDEIVKQIFNFDEVVNWNSHLKTET